MDNLTGLDQLILHMIYDYSLELRDAFNRYDFDYIYSHNSWHSASSETFYDSVFTKVCLDLGINPLDYVTHIWPDMYHNLRNITDITIPSHITSIDDRAFSNCNQLTAVEIGHKVERIGNFAFYMCKSLSSIMIPNSVSVIDRYAFYECHSLTDVTLGSGLTTIAFGVFRRCINLRNVVYNGTKAQFERIDKDDNWRDDSAIEVIHCTDGDLEYII